MRVLVAEDEPGVAGFLKQGLNEAGYAVDLVRDGVEALDFIETITYDLIILDIMMPRLDGLSLLRRLRSQVVQAPVLMLTARDELDDKIRGLDAGADDYLTKPFSLPELLARMRALLRRPAPSVDLLLRVGQIEMDLPHRAVAVAGQPLALTVREFSLLEMFLRHPGQVLSRAQLSQAVWENCFDTGTNVIDVYVGYLRRKLDRGRDGSSIETVRGVGYRLKNPV